MKRGFLMLLMLLGVAFTTVAIASDDKQNAAVCVVDDVGVDVQVYALVMPSVDVGPTADYLYTTEPVFFNAVNTNLSYLSNKTDRRARDGLTC